MSGEGAGDDPWGANRDVVVEARRDGTSSSPAQVINSPHGDKKVRFLLHDRHSLTDPL